MNCNREFRAWHKPTKRIFEVWAFNSEFIYQDTTTLLNFDIDNCVVKTIDCVLEQCTGLKDKNGNLIYEGDIVKFSFIDEVDTGNFGAISRIKYIGKGKIIFESGCFVLINLKTNYKIPCFDDKLQFIKIIGNVHENPELLEGK